MPPDSEWFPFSLGAFMTTEPILNLEAEIETLKEVYAAINRNDISAALKSFDPEIERIEPEGFSLPGVYRGLAEVGAHLMQGRETWLEGGCEPEKFIAVSDKVVVHLHVRVRLKNNLDWIEGRLADVFTFRKDKVIQMRTFDDLALALEWAKRDSDKAIR
jgi:ketosteroid isomerase-like protein